MAAKETSEGQPSHDPEDESFSEDLATTPPPKSIETVKAASDAVAHHERDRRDARIRERAYQMWEEHGRPDGSHDQFWLDAEAEIARQA